MEARNRNNTSISNILLFIAIIIIIIMSIYIYNLNNKLNNIKIISENTTKSENTIIEKTTDKKNTKDDKEFFGVWKTYEAIDSNTGEIITNLSKVFGSSYLSFGSTLKLNEDGTFLDSIYPITSSEVSVEGTYKVERNLYKQGDCYIFLTYSDKTEKAFMVTYENNIPILTSAVEDQKYQFDLKKQDQI